ncbi:MAG: ribonuclease P protein component [Calditrichaeota bacterium]|nr:ribonuclease P protein component [Calditrichota bacterium]MCB9369311.1 ribonuclease P protein component [Calditrichota bacterium]
MPGQPGRKFACAATRKVGSAVVRNYHRRKLKEFYRLNKSLWPQDGHIFCLFRSKVEDWPSFEKRLSALLNSLP